MKPTNGKIVVRVDLAQKNKVVIGGVECMMALSYEINYREKSPVIAEVMSNTECVRQGEFILCHHNHFSGKTYHLQDNLYSIPADHTIFAVLHPSGELSPVYGNVLAAKVEIETRLPVPPEQREHYKDRGLIIDGGWTEFKQGDLVFTRPSAIYEIVYIWGQQERRICKINSAMICAVVEKN